MKIQPRKQKLIDTAYRLFNQYGYHATGIDRILLESGVSKATLYKYYRSKEELILAVLAQRHAQLEALIRERMEAAQDDAQPALAIFDSLDEWFRAKDFYGCNFIHASAEYTQVGDAIHQYVARHKESIRKLIEQHLNVPDRKARLRLSRELMLLVDGAIVAAHARGERKAAVTAKRVAECLLSAQQGSGSGQ
ncbi:TetR/AcrR family transcriptional regulator [Sedimenticola sp.]|uniref:TetR/AcrR family transcriptional regulator n=1 Tax=Sedimenticola sp. TaxID=1940285 RepID=UPI003D0D000C